MENNMFFQSLKKNYWKPFTLLIFEPFIKRERITDINKVISPSNYHEVNSILKQLNTEMPLAVQIYTKPYDVSPSESLSLPFEWHQRQLRILESTRIGSFQKKYRTRKSYISYMKNACFSDGVLIDKSNNMNKDSVYHYFNIKIGIKKFPEKEIISIDEPVFYLGSTRSYYHWIMDCLSALFLWKELGLDRKMRLLVTDITDFKRKTLRAYGIPDKAVLEHKNTQIIVKNIFIPSTIGGGQAWTPMQFLPEFHRKSVAHIKATSNANEKIYISRSKTESRPMNNEKDVEIFLIKRGFDIVFLEDFTFHKQIELMKSASLIIAPHGAGLTNLIYCLPNTLIIELLCKRYLNTCFYLLSNISKLKYIPLVSSQYKVTGEHHHSYNWNTKIDELDKLLDHLEGSGSISL